MEDIELIERAKNGDEKCLDTLMASYKKLVTTISRKYFIIGADINDVIQEGMIGLFNAYTNFDKEKNAQFKTFATICINRQIISAIKKAYKFSNELTIDDNLNILTNNSPIISPEEDFIFHEEYKLLLKEIEKQLSKKEQEILYRFLENKSYDEIAEELSTTKKSVDNALSRIRNKLKYLNK